MTGPVNRGKHIEEKSPETPEPPPETKYGGRKISRLPKNIENKVKKIFQNTLRMFRRVYEFTMRRVNSLTRIFHLPGLRGAIHRKEVAGTRTTQEINPDSLRDEKLQKAAKAVESFAVIPLPPYDTHPLNDAQKSKAEELKTKEPGDMYQHLLDTCKRIKATRQDLNLDAWLALDGVNLELTREHFENLNELFNTDYFSAAETIMKDKYNLDYKESLVAEALAKALAYIMHTDGETIDIPVRQKEGGWKLATYTIRENTMGKELPYKVLESENGPPWVIPRGTELITYREGNIERRPASAESILADLNPKKGLAHKVTESDNLQKDFQSLRDKYSGRKVMIAGHSLGGFLASQFTVDFNDCVQRSYAFSGTGVSNDAQQKWNQLDENNKPDLINYPVDGDAVPAVGRRMIGRGYALKPAKKPKRNDPIHNHGRHNLVRSFTIFEIDVEKESKKTMRLVAESIRRTIGYPFHFLTKRPHGENDKK